MTKCYLVKILIIGSGAKEHALIWKLLASEKYPDPEIYVCPGNCALNKIVHCLEADIKDLDQLLDIAIARNIDLTIVGESFLFQEAIVDKFKAAGKLIFGPTQAASQIEHSNYLAKKIIMKYGIPSINFAIFDNYALALAYLQSVSFPVRIRPDKIYSSDFICQQFNSLEEAQELLAKIFRSNFLATSEPRVIIEEVIQSYEFTINTIVDGKRALTLPPVQAYREQDDRGFVVDQGAYAPTPLVDDELMARIRFGIIDPLVDALAREELSYSGLLCFDIVCPFEQTEEPKLVQLRTNILDSDAQVVFPLLDEDLLEVMLAASRSSLNIFSDGFHKFYGSALSVNVIPNDKTKEFSNPLHSLQLIENIDCNLEQYYNSNNYAGASGVPLMFYGVNNSPQLPSRYLANSEIFGVTAVAENLLDAQIIAYKLVDNLELPAKLYCKSVGDQGLIN